MKYFMIATLVVALSACAADKTPLPTGGSKADGLVEMSYESLGLEIPNVDWEAAQRSATKRCQAWGYARADAFEGTRSQCSMMGMYGCNAETVTRTYQCVGN